MKVGNSEEANAVAHEVAGIAMSNLRWLSSLGSASLEHYHNSCLKATNTFYMAMSILHTNQDISPEEIEFLNQAEQLEAFNIGNYYFSQE
jgi:hypothetical protein